MDHYEANHIDGDLNPPNEPIPPNRSAANANPQQLLSNGPLLSPGGHRVPTSTSGSSQDSDGSNGFVKVDHNDFTDIPADLLADYGNRMANEVLEEVARQGGGGDSTPADEPTSPLSNIIMDERDLDLNPGAGAAELHPAPGETGYHPFAPAQHPTDGLAEEGQLGQAPSPTAVHHHQQHYEEQRHEPFVPHTERREEQLIDFTDHPEEPNNEQHRQLFGNSPAPTTPPHELDTIPEPTEEPTHHHREVHHSPVEPQEPEHKYEHHEERHHTSTDSTHPQESIQEAVNDVHEEVEDVLEQLSHAQHQYQQTPEQNSPSAESGHDTLGNLIDEDSPREEHHKESENTGGMREPSPDETTYERKGPLTIPASVSSGTQQRRDTEDNEPEVSKKPYGHIGTEPRPPTPPKDLSEPSEEKPTVVDLGPPSHPHPLHSRSSEQRLHSILKHGSGPWIDFSKNMDPRVLDLVYWRDPKKSGAALALTLAVVFLFAKVPFLSLVVYSALAVLAGTLGFRVFKLVEAQVKKTDASNPFHPYLERDIVVPQERVHAQVDVLVEHAQSVLIQLRRLFLVENLLDSIKFGLLLWTLTYIAAWFSGLALVVIFVLGVFAVPKFYEVNKQPIDQYLAIAHENVEKVNNTLQDKLPFLKKAPARVAQEAKKEE